MGLEPIRGCPQQILSLPAHSEVFGMYKNGLEVSDPQNPHFFKAFRPFEMKTLMQ